MYFSVVVPTGKDKLHRSQSREMSGEQVANQRPPPDVVMKPSNQVTVPNRRPVAGQTGMSQSTSSKSLGSQTLPSKLDGQPPKMVTFGQLHPHNLIRESPDEVPSQRRSPLPERNTNTLPLTGKTTPTTLPKVPIRIHRQYIPPSTQERDDYISYTIFSPRQKPGEGGTVPKPPPPVATDATEFVVLSNCDVAAKVSKDRTTDV